MARGLSDEEIAAILSDETELTPEQIIDQAIGK